MPQSPARLSLWRCVAMHSPASWSGAGGAGGCVVGAGGVGEHMPQKWLPPPPPETGGRTRNRSLFRRNFVRGSNGRWPASDGAIPIAAARQCWRCNANNGGEGVNSPSGIAPWRVNAVCRVCLYTVYVTGGTGGGGIVGQITAHRLRRMLTDNCVCGYDCGISQTTVYHLVRRGVSLRQTETFDLGLTKCLDLYGENTYIFFVI